MTGTTAIAMMFLFVVDLADLYFLGLLGEIEVTAAVGFASSVLFFTGAVGIGLAVATGALVARALGAGRPARARRYVAHAGLFGLIVTVPTAAALWIAVPGMLDLLGADGRAHRLAALYLEIVLPTMPLFAAAIAAAGVLRAAGAARLAMLGTVAGGLVNAALDPLLIFGFDMGIAGAAWASVAARATALLIGGYGVVRRQGMMGPARPALFAGDAARILAIAGPAVLANVATPFGNAYVTASMADFGDHAVAAYIVIARIVPVAFGVVLALSGAVGPVIGQNFGARNFRRVRQALRGALVVSSAAVLVSSLLLLSLQQPIARTFGASGPAAEIWRFYASFIAVLYLFTGAQFVSNAAFNNLGRPLWSTVSNWGRATLGTIPLVWLGAVWLGPQGILMGHAAGGVIFGTGAFLLAWRLAAPAPEPG